MISANVLAEYQASRPSGTDRSVLCHAPFVSLNFDQSGRVSACCYNRQYLLGTYPELSVREIWAGSAARAMRAAFLAGSSMPGCDRCFAQLATRNFSGALMRNFDRFGSGGTGRAAIERELPMVLEFEIANTCALECVMCGGHWSSAIRARRERLPPLRNPYDDAFLRQIEELLPTIVAAKFLGGEPFLIPSYLEIWDAILRLNPDARISITTSGAVLPERQRQTLEQLRADIVVSLDGVTKATYESIRRNASFDQVFENLRYFRAYTRQRNTSLSAAICPMTHNWRELPAIVDFCEANQMAVFFNTVTFPIESSLAGLDETGLAAVIDFLEAGGTAGSRAWTAGSRAQWQGLLNQLRGWWREKQEGAERAAALAESRRRRAVRERSELLDRFGEAKALLRDANFDPSRRAPIERHLEALVAARLHPESEGVDGASLRSGGILEIQELRDALEAARLFHLAFSPVESRDTFLRRLDRVAALLSPEDSEELLRALGTVEVSAIYAFLSSVPDAEFERALREFTTRSKESSSWNSPS